MNHWINKLGWGIIGFCQGVMLSAMSSGWPWDWRGWAVLAMMFVGLVATSVRSR